MGNQFAMPVGAGNGQSELFFTIPPALTRGGGNRGGRRAGFYKNGEGFGIPPFYA
jgi:hypothetical protein